MYTIPSLCITASTPSAGILYCLPDAAEKITTKLGAFNISNFLILDFIISQKSKPICGRGGSPGDSVGEGFHAAFLASGSCQKSLVYPGLGLRTPISAPSLCGLLLVSLHLTRLLSLIGTLAIVFRAHSDDHSDDLIAKSLI